MQMYCLTFKVVLKKDDPAPLSDFAVPENIFEIPRGIGSWGGGGAGERERVLSKPKFREKCEAKLEFPEGWCWGGGGGGGI